MVKKKKKTKITEIPITIISIEDDGFHLLIPVKINNKKAKLLIDTGASRTVFDKDRMMHFVGNNKDQYEENQKLSTGIGTNALKSQAFILNKLTLGDLKIKKYPAVVLDMVHINISYENLKIPAIDGVVGGDILSKYKAVINYKKKTLKLYFT